MSDIEKLAEMIMSSHRTVAYQGMKVADSLKPSTVHMAMYALVKRRKLDMMVSEAGDGMFVKAGLPPTKVVELSGQSTENRVISFQEDILRSADVCICMGIGSQTTSNEDYVPYWCKSEGAKLVIIGNESSPLESSADLVIRGNYEATITSLMEKLYITIPNWSQTFNLLVVARDTQAIQIRTSKDGEKDAVEKV